MILREAPMKALIARRDELERQVAAINFEVARRAREAAEQQNRERAAWCLQNRNALEEQKRVVTLAGAR